MKKFLSIIMVLAMVLSLSITAFAAENEGSITITNATIDETYGLYKIFDASISKDADGNTNAVSYSIETDNQFFAALFGTDGTADNTYFVYNVNTGSVTKKEGVNDSELIKYLTELVKNGTYETAVAPVKATSDEVKFENLPYGYYLITSTLGTTVTINSNTPDVEVIDKNQKPGGNFDKQIQIGVDAEGNPIWGDSNSANIADEVTYKISFAATNYDGENKIKYYQMDGMQRKEDATHNHVVRQIVSSSYRGDRLGQVAADAEVSKEYVFDIDPAWNLDNTYIYVLSIDADGVVNNMNYCLLEGGESDYILKQ